MKQSISVDPLVLEKASKDIRNLEERYASMYKSIFSDVDSIGSAWQGKDNQEFVSAIKSYTTSFEKMAKFLENTSMFLSEASKAYQQTQSAVASGAKKLANR